MTSQTSHSALLPLLETPKMIVTEIRLITLEIEEVKKRLEECSVVRLIPSYYPAPPLGPHATYCRESMNAD